MTRIIKWLAIVDACMFVLFIMILFTTRNSNDFSGLYAVLPLIAVMFLTVAILVLLFLRSVNNVAKGGVPRDAFGLIAPVAMLIGIPWLGYHYATIGQNRENLLFLSEVALVVGGIASLILVIRFMRSLTRKR